MKYLQQKLLAYIRTGGESARCPLSGEYIGANGEYHHIFGRVGTDLLELVSDPHLCIYISSKSHRLYHDKETTTEQKDIMFQALYTLWGGYYGSKEIAYQKVMEAYTALDNATYSKISYKPPLPIGEINRYEF